MAFPIARAKQVVAERITDTISGYLTESTIQGLKKTTDLSLDTDSIISEVFLSFIHTRASFLDYDTFISDKEFEAHDLTRCLTADQRSSINSKRVLDSVVNDFILKLQKSGGIADIAADVDHYEDFPLCAVIGHLKRGDVCLAQVASICLLFQGIKQFIIERAVVMCYELPPSPTHLYYFYLENQRPFPQVSTHYIFDSKAFIQTYFKLTDLGMEGLLKRLETKPDSEKYYHTIPLPMGPFYSWSPGYHRVIEIIGFLSPVEWGDSRKFKGYKRHAMVIPSFSMLEAYSQLSYPQPISYLPLMGECNKATITFFKLRDKRVFQLGMPQALTPNEADGEYFGPYGFSLHDYYHGERDNYFKKPERRAISYIVDRIFSLPLNMKTFDIAWRLMDGELILKNHGFGDLLVSNVVKWDDAHIRRIIEDMALLPDFWQSEFGISAVNLSFAHKAMYDAFVLLITDAQKKEEQEALFRYYKKRAPVDDRFAQFRLGYLYFSGQGVEVSYPDAIRHWEISGQDSALYHLGLCYGNGLGVQIDKKKALSYYLKAASTYAAAQLTVGLIYSKGEEGVVNQDLRKARIYFERAARQGNTTAMSNLGVMHRDGLGCDKDLNKALSYFQQAAE